MYYYIFGGIIILLLLWVAGSYLAIRGLEKPTYTVLDKKDGYEIRQYDPYIVAEATVSGDYSQSLNEGFRVVADYIFGNNTTKEKISMASPVIEAPQTASEKISMTTPVLSTEAGENKRVVAFVLPSKYTLDTLPIPNNDQVRLREVESQKMAALTFTWYATSKRVETKKVKLQSLLEKDSIEPIGSPRSALYNPPLSMPLTLRNEILIPIE